MNLLGNVLAVFYSIAYRNLAESADNVEKNIVARFLNWFNPLRIKSSEDFTESFKWRCLTYNLRWEN